MSDKDPASEKLLGEEDATNPSVDNDKEDAVRFQSNFNFSLFLLTLRFTRKRNE